MTIRKRLPGLLAITACVSLVAIHVGQASDKAKSPELPPLNIETKTFMSGSYEVDQIYRSMKGPQATDNVLIGGGSPPERVWILSYETEIVDPETGADVSSEYMCHNNLELGDLRHHLLGLGTRRVGQRSPRVFTLSQGAMSVAFPDGFGVPMLSNEKLQLTTQILNLNPIDQSRQVQYKTTVRFVRDREAKGRIRPLYQKGVQGLKLLSGPDGFYSVEVGASEGHGESCSIGELAGKNAIKDPQGRTFAAHWVVEPGLEENHTLVTKMLDLQMDTTVHYIGVHLHPFAKTLELIDLTTGESVFKSNATNSTDRIGLEHVEYYSSAEGFPLYKDHEYTLVSVYDNTSGEPQDAMAVMLMYINDVNFEARYQQSAAQRILP